MIINGTAFNDNESVNGDGKYHKSLVGTNQADSIYGLAGDDILRGLGGNDDLDGGSGNDYLYGGDGSSNLYGRSGNDRLIGQNGNDLLYGGLDNDYLNSGPGSDKLYGEAGDDNLYGSVGNDTLIGDSGKDYLDGSDYGSSENDFDILTGGTGADTFVVGDSYKVRYLGNGHATITDFSLVQGDKIKITGKFADGYSLKLGNWGGTPTQDTGIFFKGNLIGAVQDQNITNVSPSQLFISAPPPA